MQHAEGSPRPMLDVRPGAIRPDETWQRSGRDGAFRGQRSTVDRNRLAPPAGFASFRITNLHCFRWPVH